MHNIDLKQEAQQWIEKGYSVIPVNAYKECLAPWKKWQENPMTEKEIDYWFSREWVEGIAMVCGFNDVQCLDVDVKYFDKDYWTEFKGSVDNRLLKTRFRVHKTKNNGYHIVFRCLAIGKNTALACRETTDSEVKEVLKSELFQSGSYKKACIAAAEHKSLVLFETREEGGYFVLPPTLGYQCLSHSEDIPFWTPEEREEVYTAARSLNKIFRSAGTYKLQGFAGLYEEELDNPFEAFNKYGSGLDILHAHGWESVSHCSDGVRLRRPGNPNSTSSALYSQERNTFYCFSTSTYLEANKMYSAAMLFTELECGGDSKEAYRKLLEAGFGKRPENKDLKYIEKILQLKNTYPDMTAERVFKTLNRQ